MLSILSFFWRGLIFSVVFLMRRLRLFLRGLELVLSEGFFFFIIFIFGFGFLFCFLYFKIL